MRRETEAETERQGQRDRQTDKQKYYYNVQLSSFFSLCRAEAVPITKGSPPSWLDSLYCYYEEELLDCSHSIGAPDTRDSEDYTALRCVNATGEVVCLYERFCFVFEYGGCVTGSILSWKQGQMEISRDSVGGTVQPSFFNKIITCL